MNFNAPEFLCFFPAVLGGYWLLPHRFRKYWLLAASYFFYMYANPALIVLLLVSTAVDYGCSMGIQRMRGDRRAMRLLLCISLCTNLGLLFTFKYFDFFADTVNQLCAAAAIGYRVPRLGLILPVGISFYTFQTMSYTIDVYRGEAEAERDPVTFALFVSYFPQLVAGPIERAADLLPQLKAEHRLSRADLTAGARLMLCGFFRKCVAADLCGIYVDRVFADLSGANSLAVFLGGALFCAQMYCDFSGYSEIAAGCARMMGVRLMRNFDRPYRSQSYSEFFRRWHISLNRWFTSYVYIPLGGSRRGKARRAVNTMAVFLLCGLWHGASWTYVLWGAYAGAWVCVEGLLRKPFRAWCERRRIDLSQPLVKLFRRGYMLLIFVPAAILFRAASVSDAGAALWGLLSRWGLGNAYLLAAAETLGLTVMDGLRLGLTLMGVCLIHRFGEYGRDGAAAPLSAPGDRLARGTAEARTLSTYVYMTLLTALCWLALLADQSVSGFAYFRF